MHTLALASNGTLYSWGCNDDGALGRVGPENVPGRVDGTLDIPTTDMSTGDCHSIAYSTSQNTVFYWGSYKVSEHTLNFDAIFELIWISKAVNRLDFLIKAILIMNIWWSYLPRFVSNYLNFNIKNKSSIFRIEPIRLRPGLWRHRRAKKVDWISIIMTYLSFVKHEAYPNFLGCPYAIWALLLLEQPSKTFGH